MKRRSIYLFLILTALLLFSNSKAEGVGGTVEVGRMCVNYDVGWCFWEFEDGDSFWIKGMFHPIRKEEN